MKKAVLFIADKYNNIVIRLIVTFAALLLAFLVWHFILSPSPPSPPSTSDCIAFQNLWLICAYVVTCLITGLLFLAIVINDDNARIRGAASMGFFIVIGFIILIFVCTIYFHSSFFLLTTIPVIYAGAVFVYDIILYRAGLPGLEIRKKWLPFDVAVLAGVFAVLVLQYVINGITQDAIYGFGGGASAFQLIMANIVFDPSNYLDLEGGS